MTQNTQTDGERGTTRISHELSALLGVSGEESLINIEGKFEERVIRIIIDALAIYGKDRNHIMKISQLSSLLAGAIGLGARYSEVLEAASLVYDIGNLAIDPEIYKKDNKLSFEEFEIIKHHTTIGQKALLSQHNPMLDMAALISAQHHEWYDGSGYPAGLKGEEISLPARIVAVADTVAALCSPRYGREIMDFDKVLIHMQRGSGLHFDPEVIERFMENKEQIALILECTMAEPTDTE